LVAVVVGKAKINVGYGLGGIDRLLLVIDGLLGNVNDLAVYLIMVPDSLAGRPVMGRPAMRGLAVGRPTHGMAISPVMATVESPVVPGAVVTIELAVVPVVPALVHPMAGALVALELAVVTDVPALFHPLAGAVVLVDSLGLVEGPVLTGFVVAGIGLGQAGDGHG
jgi:hypothetical protein